MAYIGYKPADKPLTSADITDSIITSAKITDGTIALADLSATGTKDATTFLRGDNTFATPAAGAFVFLGETSASNVATVDLNGYFTSTYDYYQIYIDDHYGTVANQTCMQFSTTGSYTVQTSNYISGNSFISVDSGGATPSGNNYWNQNRLLINAGVSTTSTQVSNTIITIYNPMGSNVKTFTSQFSNVSGNIDNLSLGSGGGRWNSTTAITGVRFLQLSGNIYARKIRMYGIKNS